MPATVTSAEKRKLVATLRKYAGSERSRSKLAAPMKIIRSPNGDAR